MKHLNKLALTTIILLLLVVLSGCAAGNERFVAEPAGFWWGLWHGAISCITLVVGIFNDQVHVYEVTNTGGWYDFGFLLGVTFAVGGGGRGGEHTWRSRRTRTERHRNREEWEQVGSAVEAKLKRKLRRWAEDETEGDWPEIEDAVEAKFRELVKEWAEEGAPQQPEPVGDP